jgi:hypothetical protein
LKKDCFPVVFFSHKGVKKWLLDTLKALFEKKKVLNMKQLCKALKAATRVTAFRYLRQLNHLTSYIHK